MSAPTPDDLVIAMHGLDHLQQASLLGRLAYLAADAGPLTGELFLAAIERERGGPPVELRRDGVSEPSSQAGLASFSTLASQSPRNTVPRA